jgi:hypothetical protein
VIRLQKKGQLEGLNNLIKKSLPSMALPIVVAPRSEMRALEAAGGYSAA